MRASDMVDFDIDSAQEQILPRLHTLFDCLLVKERDGR